MEPSRPTRIQRLDQLLPEAGPVRRLLATARRLAAVDRVLPVLLGAREARHLRAAGLSETVLTLVTSSPGRALRLRYEQDRLLAEFRQLPGLSGLTRIDIRTSAGQGRAPAAAEPPPARTAQAPGAEGCQALESLAEQVDCPQLRAVLGRLAARGRA